MVGCGVIVNASVAVGVIVGVWVTVGVEVLVDVGVSVGISVSAAWQATALHKRRRMIKACRSRAGEGCIWLIDCSAMNG